MNANHSRRNASLSGTLGDVPTTPSMWNYDPAHEVESRSQIHHGQGGKASRSGKLNLRAVSDVLEGYGLDPIEELAKVLTTQEPHRARDGTIIKDENGEPILKPVVDMDTKVKLLTELAQYTRPKLKSVEVVNKGPELTDDQIDRRLQALMSRTTGAKP